MTRRDPSAGNIRRNQVYAVRSRGKVRFLRITSVRTDVGMVVVAPCRRDGRDIGGVHQTGPLKGLPRLPYPQYCSFAGGVMQMPPGWKLVAIAGKSVATSPAAAEARAA